VETVELNAVNAVEFLKICFEKQGKWKKFSAPLQAWYVC